MRRLRKHPSFRSDWIARAVHCPKLRRKPRIISGMGVLLGIHRVLRSKLALGLWGHLA